MVLAPSWLGDAVMATPFLGALRERLPAAAVVVVCREYVAEVFRRNPAVDSIVEYKEKSLRARIAAARGARAGDLDVCFVLPPSFSAALVSLCAGARRRIGYGGNGRRMLLTDTPDARGYRSGHLSEAYLRLLERYTGAPEPAAARPAVTPPETWPQIALDLAGPEAYIVLAPGATYGSAKVWPHERYAALARLLLDRFGGTAVIVGTADERHGAAALAETIGARARSLAGALSPAALFAVLRGARIAIGNDSGPVHVSAALGTPTVAVFGPTSVEWTAPRGPAVRIVREAVSCAPCFKRECPFGSPACLERIDADRVFEAAVSLIGDGRK
jgi:heptosyltransferase-2